MITLKDEISLIMNFDKVEWVESGKKVRNDILYYNIAYESIGYGRIYGEKSFNGVPLNEIGDPFKLETLKMTPYEMNITKIPNERISIEIAKMRK